MSRHRNVRSLNYEDEYYDDDDVYGHSVEDNYCISPGTAAQFTFNRDRNVDLSNFMGHEEGIPEEEEEDFAEDDGDTPRSGHRSSLDYTRPQLNDVDQAKLNSCLEEVRNVVGETVPENIMVDIIIKCNFSLESSLNELLSQQDKPKPQREPRKNRRNRAQELDEDYESDTNDAQTEDSLVFTHSIDNPVGVMKFGASPVSPLPVKLMKQNVDKHVSKVGPCEKQSPTVSSDIKDKMKSLSDLISNVSLEKSSVSKSASSDKTLVIKDKAELENFQHVAMDPKKETPTQLSGLSLSEMAKSHGVPTGPLKLELTKSGTNLTSGTSPSLQQLASKSESGTVTNVSLSDLAKTLGISGSGLEPKGDLSHSKLSNLGTQSSGLSLSGLTAANTCTTSMPCGLKTFPSQPGLESNLPTTSVVGKLESKTGELNFPSPCTVDKNIEHLGTLKDSLSALASGCKKSKPSLVQSSIVLSSEGTKQPQVLTDPGNQSGMSLLSQLAMGHTQQFGGTLSLSDLAKRDGEQSKTKHTDINSNVPVASGNKCDLSSKLTGSFSGEKLSLSSLIQDKIPLGEMTIERQAAFSSVPKPVDEKPAISLTSLLKEKSELKMKQIKEKESEALKSLENLDVKDDKKLHKKTKPSKTEDKDKIKDIKRLLHIDDEENSVKIDIVKCKPSSLGKTVCLKFVAEKPDSTDSIVYKNRKFAYSYQMKKTKQQSPRHFAQIRPFDFNSPSPDDIVKSKQKMAFTR